MKPYTPPEVTKLLVNVFGPAEVTPGPIPGQRLLTEPHTKRANLAGRAFELDVAPGTQVSQMITVLVQGPECIAVVTSAIKWDSVYIFAILSPPAVFINCEGDTAPTTGGPPVSKVLLHPQKAYRHVHDSITITVRAFNASGAPVPCAKIALALYGDCDPTLTNTVKTTGADGAATVTVWARRPGAVSVMAAGVGTVGAPVLSEASHIFFFTERHHADEREREYYGRHFEDRCVRGVGPVVARDNVVPSPMALQAAQAVSHGDRTPWDPVG
jgi:hypothetical protein